MIATGERVLVAVSGGKDSLALWICSWSWATEPTASISVWGSRATASRRGSTPGVSPPAAASTWWRSTSRPTTASTSVAAPRRPAGPLLGVRALQAPYLRPRHPRGRLRRRGHRPQPRRRGGRAARQRAAVGLAYLARQRPVLPGGEGFPRKVKPLVRLGERETAAYCVLRGIDYQVEECPMAVGNKHLGYKDALNAIEERSPGTKATFYVGFLSGPASWSLTSASTNARGFIPVRLRGADYGPLLRLLPSGGPGRGPAPAAHPPRPAG